jgi:4-hydroxybenzoate polyprenyltransferase
MTNREGIALVLRSLCVGLAFGIPLGSYWWVLLPIALLLMVAYKVEHPKEKPPKWR